MEIVSIEELTKILSDNAWNSLHHKETAEQIHALYNPAMKPLSELANDEESCREIFYFITNLKDYEDITVDLEQQKITITGSYSDEWRGNSRCLVRIWFYGIISMEVDKDEYPLLKSVFDICDFFKGLGYHPLTK